MISKLTFHTYDFILQVMNLLLLYFPLNFHLPNFPFPVLSLLLPGFSLMLPFFRPQLPLAFSFPPFFLKLLLQGCNCRLQLVAFLGHLGSTAPLSCQFPFSCFKALAHLQHLCVRRMPWALRALRRAQTPADATFGLRRSHSPEVAGAQGELCIAWGGWRGAPVCTL